MASSLYPDRPWGAFPATGPARFWLAIARSLPGGWPWNRFALLARRFARRRLDGPVDVRLWGLALRLFPHRSVSESRILFLPRSWDRAERRWLGRSLHPAFTFVDVGANVGAYSFWVLAQSGPASRIVAVEPNPDLACQLHFNIAANAAHTRMTVVEAAVSERSGSGRLTISEPNSGENRLLRPDADPDAGIAVAVLSLAEVVAAAGLERIDCLKVDVEGHEAQVLRPFLTTAPASLWPRLLVVEMKPSESDPPGFPGALALWLTRRGYRLELRTKLNGLFRLDSPRPALSRASGLDGQTGSGRAEADG